MAELISQLSSQFSAQSWSELLAVGLALAYVWLAAKQNIWCWPSALLSTGIYTWLFWEVALPFHTVLNAYYLLMALYGWYKWRRQVDQNISIQTWSMARHIKCIVGLSVVSILVSQIGAMWLDTEYLYLDAFVTVFSVFTTVLVAHKVLENWLYWLVINTFAMYLYFAKDMQLTGLLFIGYSVFAVYGYFKWRQQLAGDACAQA